MATEGGDVLRQEKDVRMSTEKDITGFFWCDHAGNYCVVILDPNQSESPGRGMRPVAVCREYRAGSPEELCRVVEAAGWVLPDDTKAICENAPSSPRIRRRAR